MTKICLTPDVHGIGGMVSFRGKFTDGLQRRGVDVTGDLDDAGLDAVLVIGGTKNMAGLRRVRQRGVRVVQRLNGLNWMHRIQRTGIRHYLRSEYGNWILKTIRNRLVDGVIYQSEFARGWWHLQYGESGKPETVVYNAVELNRYKPVDGENPPEDRYRLLVIEGNLAGGYEHGLESAVGIVKGLAEHPDLRETRPVELMVVGRASDAVRKEWTGKGVDIDWMGAVPAGEIPSIDRQAHLLFSSDLNAACPNAVIEALACGTPVLAYDTGALPEMVSVQAGQVVPYGSDPWKLDPPNVDNLVAGAVRILNDQPSFRRSARQYAEATFDLDEMIDRYLEFLLGT